MIQIRHLPFQRLLSKRILEIVKSLRTFSRLDEAEYRAVDLHEGLDITLMILQSQLKGDPTRPQIEVIKNNGILPPLNARPVSSIKWS